MPVVEASVLLLNSRFSLSLLRCFGSDLHFRLGGTVVLVLLPGATNPSETDVWSTMTGSRTVEQYNGRSYREQALVPARWAIK